MRTSRDSEPASNVVGHSDSLGRPRPARFKVPYLRPSYAPKSSLRYGLSPPHKQVIRQNPPV
jgi:hypothetical protein